MASATLAEKETDGLVIVVPWYDPRLRYWVKYRRKYRFGTYGPFYRGPFDTPVETEQAIVTIMQTHDVDLESVEIIEHREGVTPEE